MSRWSEVEQPAPVGARDRRSLVVQVYDDLRRQMSAGRYPPGSRLPSEAELTRLFNVSRVTVREALRMLGRDLLVEARHGSGHYVLSYTGLVRKPISELYSVTEVMREFGYPVETQLLAAKRMSAGDLASELEVEAADEVWRVDRLIASDGEPMILSIDFLPVTVVGASAPDWRSSVLRHLEARGYRIAAARARLRAAPLPAELVARVPRAHSHCWMLIEQVIYAGDHRPVIYSYDYYRGDKFEFHALRQRQGDTQRLVTRAAEADTE